MKIESTAPTAAAVSSAQPAVRMAASNHSPWRSRAPHHPTLHRPLSTFPHPRVSGLSPQCFHFDCHSQTPLSPPHSLTLSNVFPFWPAGQHWAGRAGGVTSCCPQLAQTAWPGLQRFSVSHADMQQHAALGCCMHNQPDLKGLRNMGAFI